MSNSTDFARLVTQFCKMGYVQLDQSCKIGWMQNWFTWTLQDRRHLLTITLNYEQRRLSPIPHFVPTADFFDFLHRSLTMMGFSSWCSTIIRAPWTAPMMIGFSVMSHKIFLKCFCKSQFPHKPVNLFFILVIVKDTSTDLWVS